VSRPRHSAKNKSLPSATTMTLGKEIKELKKYIYKHKSASMITIF